jgi:arylsulfatase A-like enzyme
VRPTGWRTALVAVVGAGLAVGMWWRSPTEEARLPDDIRLEDTVATVPVPADATALEPGDRLDGAGARTSIVPGVPGRIPWRVAVEPATALRFGVAVDGERKRDPQRSGIRFWVAVDGRRVYERLVNPAASRRDRRWFDEHVDLGRWAGRTVEVVFGTEADDPGGPPAGRAGWSHVRIVRETTRARQPATRDAPNVLVLLVDTLRADRLGCYGATPSPSPTLDRLASEGTVFERALAQASWTLPSVASLFTGVHPRSHGVVGVRRRGRRPVADVRAGAEYLADPLATWAESAQRAGITTAAFSANPLVSRATNFAQGFETFVDFPWSREGRNWTPAATLNAAFLAWLQANRDRRFVAYLHYMEPHDPYTPPAARRPAAPDGIRAVLRDGWTRGIADRVNWEGTGHLSDVELEWVRRLYDAEIGGWDDELAVLLEALARAGVRDSTVVIVTADHGEEFQEHGKLAHGPHLYEESIRVPLVVVGPGIRAGRRTDLAQGIDVFPTLAGLLGVALPPGLPGRDLFAGTTPGPIVSETSHGIAADGGPLDLVALSAASWKLIQTPALRRTELYDLASDPREQDDRGTSPHAAQLAVQLAEWARVAPAPPRTDGGRDPAMRAKLRALGYAD